MLRNILPVLSTVTNAFVTVVTVDDNGTTGFNDTVTAFKADETETGVVQVLPSVLVITFPSAVTARNVPTPLTKPYVTPLISDAVDTEVAVVQITPSVL
jgi:hypothetical protein